MTTKNVLTTPATLTNPDAASQASNHAVYSLTLPQTGAVLTTTPLPVSPTSPLSVTSTPRPAPINTSVSSKDTPAQPPSPVAPPGTIYCAVYSGVPVYECIVREIAVMRRRPDSYLNATQILKVAGLEKGKRTKIIEKEILTGEHEKVQGGYGKYQGTWVPYERGKELAEQYGVLEILRPLIEYKPPRPEVSTQYSYSSYSSYGGLPSYTPTPTKEQAIEQVKEKLAREQAEQQERERQVKEQQLKEEQEKERKIKEQQFKEEGEKQQGIRIEEERESKVKVEVVVEEEHERKIREEMERQRIIEEEEERRKIEEEERKRKIEEEERKRKIEEEEERQCKLKEGEEKELERQKSMRQHQEQTSKEQQLRDNQTISMHSFDDDITTEPPSNEEIRSVLMAMFLSEDQAHLPDLLTDPNPPADFNVDIVIDNQGHTALHWAAALAKIPVLEMLLNKRAEVAALNSEGETALIRAVLVTNNYEFQTFKELLDSLHVLIPMTDRYNRTVFHHIAMASAAEGHAEAAEYYMACLVDWIKKQANGNLSSILNIQDKHGDTALNIAARVDNKHLVQQMIEVGADPSIENEVGLKVADFDSNKKIGIDESQEERLDSAEKISHCVTNNASNQNSRKRSREVMTALQKMIDDAEEEYFEQLKQKEDQVTDVRRQLNITHRDLNETGQKILQYRQQEKELSEVQSLVKILEQTLHEEQNSDTGPRKRPRYEHSNGHLSRTSTGVFLHPPRLVDTSRVELAVPAKTEITLSAPITTSTGMLTAVPIPVYTPPAMPITQVPLASGSDPSLQSQPPNVVEDAFTQELRHLHAQVSAYAREEDEMREDIKTIQAKTGQSEEDYKKLIATCCQISPDEVDNLVESLTQAIESDGSELDISRVKDLMRRTEEVALMAEDPM